MRIQEPAGRRRELLSRPRRVRVSDRPNRPSRSVITAGSEGPCHDHGLSQSTERDRSAVAVQQLSADPPRPWRYVRRHRCARTRVRVSGVPPRRHRCCAIPLPSLPRHLSRCDLRETSMQRGQRRCRAARRCDRVCGYRGAVMPVTDGARPETYWWSTARARPLHDYLDARTPTARLRHWPTRDPDPPHTISPLQEALVDPDDHDRYRRASHRRRGHGTTAATRKSRLVLPCARRVVRKPGEGASTDHAGGGDPIDYPASSSPTPACSTRLRSSERPVRARTPHRLGRADVHIGWRKPIGTTCWRRWPITRFSCGVWSG